WVSCGKPICTSGRARPRKSNSPAATSGSGVGGWRSCCEVGASSAFAARAGLRFLGLPGLARALFDIASQEPSYDLRGRCIFFRAQSFEESLLARIDENREPCGAFFQGQDRLTVSDNRMCATLQYNAHRRKLRWM